MKKVLVMVPTYNESENIAQLIEAILSLKVFRFEIKILVVDDNSPDGTGKIVESYEERFPKQVQLFTRIGKRGRGTAGIDGFKECIRQKADYIIEMDADFSHDPKVIPDLLKKAEEGFDLVVGSRFVPGGADADRGPVRQMLTKCAGFYIRTVLGIKNLRDVTGGFRCFRREVLENIGLEKMKFEGPAILQETMYKAVLRGFNKLGEVPIVFIDRRLGSSKLNTSILKESVIAIARLRYLNLRDRLF